MSAPQISEWIRQSSRIVVLTGAGISTDSGIPDFRGPNGVWTKNPEAEKVATLSHYLENPEIRQLAWRTRLESPAWSAIPNDGHRAIVRLHAAHKLDAVVTQNIDGLHQQSGIPIDKVVEVHGTFRFSICWDCQDRREMQSTLDRVRAGDPDPSCQLCGGILKSDTISFGQALAPGILDQALSYAENCELLIAVGTTLSVGPVNNMVPRARARGVKVAIINGEPTSMDDRAGAVAVGDISELLATIMSDAGIPT